MYLKITQILFMFLFLSISSMGQKVAKLTITDNLSTAGRFTLGKAKPAAPKDTFYLLSEKGTQVLFYTDLLETDSVNMKFNALKFTAYKEINGKDEWVDDRVLDVKTNATFLMTALNFYSTGSFKLVITPDGSNEVLSQGSFTVVK